MIRRILVANRGEIARRIFRTCERLTIETVAVYSDSDASEPHAREADIAVHLPGKTAAETYLDQKAIIEAAIGSGADAIHPGYGFLSENAGFARAVAEAGLVWIGPPPDAIAAMGSKIEAKSIMGRAGVPCLPGADLTGLDDRAIREEADRIGYPVLVKASAGGGGKGMRTVTDPAELIASVDGAAREAEGAFGDGTLFIERCLVDPRHIEIQVLADSHGNVVAIHERECSIQRRHQKIIAECPSPVITESLRKDMESAAVAAAAAVGYVGAGTVEFLFQDGEFFFLEMNTRLQVEHPVTEMVTGLDLVELQILVADGAPIPDAALEPPLVGHAMEARVYAEDPTNGFLPVTGTIHAFEFPEAPGLRIDSGVEPGSKVTVHFDPMLAKVIAHAPDRDRAAAALASALRRARIHSSKTNRDMLVRILEHDDFLAGAFNTGFIDKVGLDVLGAPLVAPSRIAAYASGAAVADRAHRSSTGMQASLPPGFRNVGVDSQEVFYSNEDREVVVRYETHRSGLLIVEPPGLKVLAATDSHAELELEDATLLLDVARYGNERYVDSRDGSLRFEEQPRFPESSLADSEGSLHAPMPGRIIRIEVSEGDQVAAGAPLIVLEAMKMEHTLRAPHGGVVARVTCVVGDQVEANDVLIVVE